MIQQLMFGRDYRFDAVTNAGQFVYYPNPNGVPGPLTTLNYSAATLTTYFNNGALDGSIAQFPQSSSGTLTVNFSFNVPAGYQLYLVCYMGLEMNRNLATIDLNGSQILSGWSTTRQNVFVANSGTSISSMSFFCSVSGSGFDDGRVIEVENFVLVPTGSTVNSSWKTEADFTSNIPGAIITGV